MSFSVRIERFRMLPFAASGVYSEKVPIWNFQVETFLL